MHLLVHFSVHPPSRPFLGWVSSPRPPRSTSLLFLPFVRAKKKATGGKPVTFCGYPAPVTSWSWLRQALINFEGKIRARDAILGLWPSFVQHPPPFDPPSAAFRAGCGLWACLSFNK